EVLARVVEVELAQHDVAHRQRHRRIGPLLRRQPQIAQFGDFSTQAARVALPPLSNSFISLVKDTSLAATIQVPELFRQAQLITSR
ncbi:hypothetical protein MJI37_33890, partial [Salmonella enterica subsp. enterica serovar Cerro]|nr:hypothetical protein [Salmonella enterica subsp. enterica serovar Cerro]